MENATLMKAQSNRLILWGVLLFFLGLITGLLIPVLSNPRMGLSSHIEGVLNGMFLILLGLIWHRVSLTPKWLKITFWLAVYGTFANWFGILLAAFLNAGNMLRVAANGQQGSPLAEAAVSFFLVTLSIAMLWLSVNLMLGLYRGSKQTHD